MKRGLGRGLSALIGEKIEVEQINLDGLSSVPMEKIVPNPNQPRVIFKQNELEELVNSIKLNGILQPILLKPLDNGNYEIIAGERRWRAAKILQLTEMPSIIKNLNDQEALEIALIENIQRENLNPLEEAETYKRLIEEYNYTQEKVAEVVSKSRSHIANLLRLLTLSDSIKKYLQDGLISIGHAKLLIGHNESDEIAEEIIKNNYNVRQTEKLLKASKQQKEPTQRKNLRKNTTNNIRVTDDILAIEEAVSLALEMPVEIEQYGDSGKITIHFDDYEEFDKIVQKLTNSIC